MSAVMGRRGLGHFCIAPYPILSAVAESSCSPPLAAMKLLFKVVAEKSLRADLHGADQTNKRIVNGRPR